MGGSHRKDGANQFWWRGIECSLILQVTKLFLDIRGLKN
jgi:hypothetical protein